MAGKKERVVEEPLEGQEVLPGAEEIPSWATAGVAESVVDLYKPPAASQWRRKLRPDELVLWIKDQITKFDDDDPRMWLEMAAQIVEMDTADKVLNGQVETTKGRTIIDRPLRVDAIKFIMSTEQGGFPYFAVLSVANPETSEVDVVSVGGARLVMQLGQLHYLSAELPEGSPFLQAQGTDGAMERETYPHFFKIRSTPTSNGRNMNYLAGLMS